MGAQGTAALNFGAFPGSNEASVAVTGQAAIVAGSLVEAWIRLEATSDHSADEHMVEQVRVIAGNIVAGTGFTIYGFGTNQLNEPIADADLRGRLNVNPGRGMQGPRESPDMVGGGRAPRLYGQFTVAWVWN